MNHEAVRQVHRQMAITEKSEEYKKAELAAIQVCDIHKTEFLIVFNTELLFEESMDDTALSIMMSVLHTRLKAEIQRLIRPAVENALNESADTNTMTDITIACFRYLNTDKRLNLKAVRECTNTCLKDVRQYI